MLLPVCLKLFTLNDVTFFAFFFHSTSKEHRKTWPTGSQNAEYGLDGVKELGRHENVRSSHSVF